jgi:hypothetical protein
MSYSYQLEKKELFTDEGQRMFLRVRDWVQSTLRTAGAFRMQEAMGAAGGGNTWTMMACVDRMVELKEIRQVTDPSREAGQHLVYVKAGS